MAIEKASNPILGVPKSGTMTVSGTTNVSSRLYSYCRMGKYMIFDGIVTWTGAGDAGTFTVTVPDSYTIDTNFLPNGTDTTNAGASVLGSGIWYDAGVGWKVIYPEFATTTTIRFSNTSALFAASVTANGDSIKFNIRIPISGW